MTRPSCLPFGFAARLLLLAAGEPGRWLSRTVRASGWRRSVCVLRLRPAREEPLGVKRRGTPGARGRHGLARLSANSLRPERRSDDGQMVLKAARVDQKLRLDLLVC